MNRKTKGLRVRLFERKNMYLTNEQREILEPLMQRERSHDCICQAATSGANFRRISGTVLNQSRENQGHYHQQE
jgi:hypothetical protein